MDFLLLTQVVMVVMVVVIDFLVLPQANHTIYDYGSFGFWVAVLAGGTTMLADGYRFEKSPKILVQTSQNLKSHEAQPSVISNFSVRFESQISDHTSPQGDVCD